MKTDRYISSVSNLFVNNRLLKFVVIVLAAMQVMNYVSAKEAEENRRTIIIPMGLSETIQVSGREADETYLSAMGVYVAQLLYSTTPSTVESQYKILLSLFTPDAYKTLSSGYLTSAVSQSKNQVTRTSKILGIVYQTKPEQYIEITLSSERYIFQDRVDEPKTIKLRIYYVIENGKFSIVGLSEE